MALVLVRSHPCIAQSLWHELEPGLRLQVHGISAKESRNADLVLLSIDPTVFDFILLSATQSDTRPLGMDEWVRGNDLVAAINASMYWEDQATSTGYMRTAGHVNNPRIHPDFGAFFVTGPQRQGLPMADIVDRALTPDWQERIRCYETAIQNYRILSADRQLAWVNESKRFSMAVVAQDADGNILFVLSRKPRTVKNLGVRLLELPVQLGPAMYVEGGPTASLYIRSKGYEQGWIGLDDFGIWSTGDTYRAVPNVIGVVRKNVSH